MKLAWSMHSLIDWAFAFMFSCGALRKAHNFRRAPLFSAAQTLALYMTSCNLFLFFLQANFFQQGQCPLTPPLVCTLLP